LAGDRAFVGAFDVDHVYFQTHRLQLAMASASSIPNTEGTMMTSEPFETVTVTVLPA